MAFDPLRDQDTICARSTPPGIGGLSIVRVSGPRATDVLRELDPKFRESIESHKATYLVLKDGLKAIDEIILTPFLAPNSFTGEDSFEITCHGNPLIVKEILDHLVGLSCRSADPGEFTYRAFINGKIDLAQAESVLSVIESQSSKAKSISLDQLRGSLTERILEIENELTWVLANFEASIDFSHEDLDVLPETEIQTRLSKARSLLQELTKSYQAGRLVKEGVKVSLIGAPNAGKSSLLNALLEEERAIVSDIAGTTRDTVTGERSINGVLIKFIDTAGLRESNDVIEMIGIERTKKAFEEADVVFWLRSGDTEEEKLVSRWQAESPETSVVELINKSDLIPEKDREGGRLYVSAKTGENLVSLYTAIGSFVESMEPATSTAIIQSRQFELLSTTEKKVTAALESLNSNSDYEIAALDLQEGLQRLYELQGKVFDDEVMDRVFSDFCIGK